MLMHRDACARFHSVWVKEKAPLPQLPSLTAEFRFYLLEYRSIKDSEVHFQDSPLKLLSASGSSLY